MQRRARLQRPRVLFLVLASLCLSVMLALPVAAQSEGGTGRLVGAEETHELEEDPPTSPPCIKVVEATMVLRGVGTYYGVTEAGERAVYRAQSEQGRELHEAGPLELSIDSEEHFIAPAGTYAERLSRSDGCDQDTYGEDGKIPATFTLHATNHVHEHGDPCTGEGHWWRVHSTIVAEWTWESGCTIEGNEAGFLGAGAVPPGTEHTLEGNFDPCFSWDWPCEDNIRVSFTQTLSRSTEAGRVSDQSVAASAPSDGNPSDEPHRFIDAGADQSGAGWWVLAVLGSSLLVLTISSRWQRQRHHRDRSGHSSA